MNQNEWMLNERIEMKEMKWRNWNEGMDMKRIEDEGIETNEMED